MATKKKKGYPETAQLRELVDAEGDQRAFCLRVWPKEDYEANKAKVHKWYHGKSRISTDQAKVIADVFGVRPAWLLFGELPKIEGTSRTRSELEQDLAKEVEHRLGKLMLPTMKIDGGKAFAAFMEMLRSDVTKFRGASLDHSNLVIAEEAVATLNRIATEVNPGSVPPGVHAKLVAAEAAIAQMRQNIEKEIGRDSLVVRLLPEEAHRGEA
jgi:hypothetical protein